MPVALKNVFTQPRPFFAISVVFFEQVHQLEDVRAEIDEGGQVGLEGCLPTTTRATDQHFLVIP